jgi:signal transduction histidine kinase
VLNTVPVSEEEWPGTRDGGAVLPWAGRRAARPAVLLLVPAALLTAAGPGHASGAAAWPGVAVTVGLAVATGGWLAGLAVLARPGGPARPRSLLVGYYLILLALLSTLVAWSPWFMLVSWTACVYVFALFEARWAFFAAALAGVALTAAQTRSALPSSHAVLPLFLLSLVAPLLVGGWWLGRESDTRRRLIAELADANSRLRAESELTARLREQLQEQAHAAGVQQERQRLAREIHDTLAQDLSAVVSQLEVALSEPALSGEIGGQHWQRPVAQARDVAREGLREARHSVRALASPLLDGGSLTGALRALAGRWQAQTGVEAFCHADDDVPPLPDEVQGALLRVAQAALANVAEHAAASRARLTLSWVDGTVLLDVWDDGAGFDPADTGHETAAGGPGRGFGLTGMRQRLALLGGQLEIESAPGGGTVIGARVPVTGEAGAATGPADAPADEGAGR